MDIIKNNITNNINKMKSQLNININDSDYNKLLNTSDSIY
jgi:hypothetical protein